MCDFETKFFILLITDSHLSFILFSNCSTKGKSGNTFYPELFSKETIKKAIELEEEHHLAFFEAAAESYSEEKINEAALFYYVGQIRIRYYISTHPNDPPDGDRAIFASIQSVIGAEINSKLGEDLENYANILSAAIEWGETKDSKYYSKKENPKEYKEILTGLKKLRQNVIEKKTNDN